MKISSEKIQSARKFVLHSLYTTVVGEKLPTVRTLIKESSSSRAAVEFILDELEKQNLIKRIPRSGIIRIAGHIKPTFELIACHDGGYVQSDFPNFLSQVINGLFKSAETKNYNLRLHSVSIDESAEHYCRIAALNDSCGFILLQPNMSEIINLFKQTNKPVVAVFPEGRFPDCDRVVTATSTISMQMQYILQKGHSRIHYLRESYHNHHSMTLMFRRLEYYRLMAENGLKIEKHWQSEYPPDCILEALEKSFSAEPIPTALIVWDKDAEIVYDFLKSKNLVIGRDVSVIATDGDLTLANLDPPVTTVFSHCEHAVQNIWDLIEKQLNGDFTPQKIEVMLIIREGLSVGMASPDNTN